MVMKFKPPELCKHEGCRGCQKECVFNSLITTKENAKLSKGDIFPCNSIIKRSENNESTN